MSNRIGVFSCALLVVAATQQFVSGQQTSTAQYIVSQQVAEDSASARSRYMVRTNPEVGNGLIGIVDRNGNIIVSGHQPGGLRDVVGLDFRSEAGLLSLQPEIIEKMPFDNIIESEPTRVSVGNLGADNTVVIGSRLDIGISYSGKSPSTDLQAAWGRDVDATPFPVATFGEVGYTPYNLSNDGTILRYESAIMSATIEAGSATGTPPDSPSNRVDPNNAMASFPGVGSLEVVHPTLGTFICSGSVISDTKVLTAGHCFDQDNDGLPDAGITTNSKFYLNDGGSPSSTLNISSVDIHPDFTGFATEGGYDDMAVVTLASSVPTGTTKYSIRNTGMATNELIHLVGYGISGFGDVGGVEVLPDFNVKRSGQNHADLFFVDDEGSGVDEVFIFDFDGPTGTGFIGGGTLGNDKETAIRGGDSGGPAFVDVAGTTAIAGIIGFEYTIGGLAPPAGEFGTMGGGPMITADKWTWIQSVAPNATLLPEPAGSLMLLPAICGMLTWRRRRQDREASY